MSCTCPHLSAIAMPSGPIYKDECTKCFDNHLSPQGIDICLTCYNGACHGELQHAKQHYTFYPQHAIVYHIQKTPIITTTSDATSASASTATSSTDVSADKPVITKLAIGVQGGATIDEHQVQYHTHKSVYCYACQVNIDMTLPKIANIIEMVDAADSIAKQDSMASWENQLQACEHTLMLQQDVNAPLLAAKSLAHCQSCEVNSSLWLCLTCGALGCSRKNFDGTGGNGHALSHFEQTGHPLVVKMGTITPEGTADIHCYACDESRLDEQLKTHLAHFGINVADQTKTVKSMAEMDLELNLNHDWSGAFESGQETELLFGPFKTGFANLGNSCYLASVLQCSFAVSPFVQRYLFEGAQHLATCKSERPAECFMCQMAKIAHGICSGRYSSKPAEYDAWKEQQKALKAAPAADSMQVELSDEEKKLAQHAEKEQRDQQFRDWQPGVAPRAFKKLIAGHHEDFRSNKQQCASEYFGYLMQEIQRRERASGVDPTQVFQYHIETRVECTECHHVSYSNEKTINLQLSIPVDESLFVKPKADADAAAASATQTKESDLTQHAMKVASEMPPVEFGSCLQNFGKDAILPDYRCSNCQKSVKAISTRRFKSFPDTLVVQMLRFIQPEWVPMKLHVGVSVPDKIDMEALRGKGLQAHEKAMPGGAAAAAACAPAQPQPDMEQVFVLMAMGFSENACKRAVVAVNNSGAEAASNWLFAHMEDADLNDPLPAPSSSSSAPAEESFNEDALAVLSSMGFDMDRCKFALKETKGDADRALDWLFSHADEPLPSVSAVASHSSVSLTDGDDGRPGRYELFAFITHLGASTTCGHYVAHVKQEDGTWALFNDSKVSKSVEPPVSQAYVYFFRKI